jgi:hypothetical protein
VLLKIIVRRSLEQIRRQNPLALRPCCRLSVQQSTYNISIFFQSADFSLLCCAAHLLRSAIIAEAEREQNVFRAALEKYHAKTVGTRYQTALNLDEVHTWEQVLETVSQVSAQYEDPKGYWGKIKKGLRRFGKNNQAFAAWAETLPSQSQYFSIICGGLKLIFGVSLPTGKSVHGAKLYEGGCPPAQPTRRGCGRLDGTPCLTF